MWHAFSTVADPGGQANSLRRRTRARSQQALALAAARTCYDHLAGRAGVTLLSALLARGILTVPANGQPREMVPQARPHPGVFEVTQAGEDALGAFGINIEKLRKARRRLAGECLDWTERKPHLNGALGAAMTSRLLDLGWIERGARRRAVRVTEAGREGLAATFGWPPDE